MLLLFSIDRHENQTRLAHDSQKTDSDTHSEMEIYRSPNHFCSALLIPFTMWESEWVSVHKKKWSFTDKGVFNMMLIDTEIY